jgi:adenylate kinase family enzyme
VRKNGRMLRADDPVPRPLPRRILVAGVSGAGKTTLARRISERLDVPHTEIDGLFHGADWTPRPEFTADVRRLAAGAEWVTEWQYDAARPQLAARAGLLVWLDLPYPLVLARVVRRTVRRSLRSEVLWNGNVEPGMLHAILDRDGVIRWSVSTRRRYRELVPALEPLHPGLAIVRLRSPREVERWLAAL